MTHKGDDLRDEVPSGPYVPVAERGSRSLAERFDTLEVDVGKRFDTLDGKVDGLVIAMAELKAVDRYRRWVFNIAVPAVVALVVTGMAALLAK